MPGLGSDRSDQVGVERSGLDRTMTQIFIDDPQIDIMIRGGFLKR
jgi:hypothetical protein